MKEVLLPTAVCKHAIGSYTAQRPLATGRFALFLRRLAMVENAEQITPLRNIGLGRYATRELRNFHANAVLLDHRPLSLYIDPESEPWFLQVVAKLNRRVIFVTDCAKKWARIRNTPEPNAEDILKCIRDRAHTPIILSSSQNDTSLRSEVKFIDLDLKKYLCLLRRVGDYVGCNTGDTRMADRG